MAQNEDWSSVGTPVSNGDDWSSIGDPVGVKPKKQNAGIAGDFATDLKRGVLGVPSAVTGLLDIPVAAVTGRPMVSEGWQGIGELTGFQPGKWAKDAEAEYSPGRKTAQLEIDEAWKNGSAGDIAGAYARNPAKVAGSIVESLPSMLAGGIAGRAAMGIGASGVSSAAGGVGPALPGAIARTVGEKLAPAVGAGIGEGGIMAGQSMSDLIEKGVDPRIAAGYAGATGIVGGAIGAAGGRVAQRLGVIDPETALTGGMTRATAEAAGKQSFGQIAKDTAKRAIGGGISEGLIEELPQSLAEQGLSNLAQNKPFTEDMARAGVEGALAGFGMGAGFNAIPARRTQPPAEQAPPVNPNVVDVPTAAGPVSIDKTAGPLSAAVHAGVPTGAIQTAQQAAPVAPEQDPFERLATLELLSEQRDLTPQESAEANALSAQLFADEAGNGTDEQASAGALVSQNASQETPTSPAVQDQPDPVMAAKSDKQLSNLSAPGHSNATRQAATAEIQRRATAPAQQTTTAPLAQVATQFNVPENILAPKSNPMDQETTPQNGPQVGIEQGAAQGQGVANVPQQSVQAGAPANSVTNVTQQKAPGAPGSSIVKRDLSGLAARDDLIGAIMRITGNKGVSPKLALDSTGGRAGADNPKLTGFFKEGGTEDLSDLVNKLNDSDEGYFFEDSRKLSEAINNASRGDVEKSMSRIEQDAADKAEYDRKSYYQKRAEELGLKKVGGKRTLDMVEADALREEKRLADLEAEAERQAIQDADAIESATEGGMTDADFMRWLSDDIASTYTPEDIQRAEQDQADKEDARIQAIAIADAEERAQGEAGQGNGNRQSAAQGSGAKEGAGSVEGFGLAAQTNIQAAEQFAQQQAETDAPTKAQADRERDAVPFSLGMQSQPKPVGVQGGLFTADGRASEAAASEPKDIALNRGDQFKDGQGKTWEVWTARTGLIEAFPVVDGKIRVNNQDGVRFAIDARSRFANPEARTDVFPITSEQKQERGEAGEQKPAQEASQKEEAKPAAVDAKKEAETKPEIANEVIAEAEAIEPIDPEDTGEKIGDFGRKVMVRKDMAQPTGPRVSTKEKDERPVWIRKYHAMQVTDSAYLRDKSQVGKWQLTEESKTMKGAVRGISSARFNTEKEAMDALPLIVAQKKHRIYNYTSKAGEQEFAIYRNITEKKRAMVRGGFKTYEEADAYLKANPVEIIEHKFGEPERPWLDRIERTGPERLTGNVTKQMFEKTFAPSGVVYGNWLLNADGTVNADGQELSNHIYNALLDLADAINVPPKALFLNGKMALGIGADGKGGKNSAAAHYSPSKALINLTKIKGAGTLAHEWWHSVDHYFADTSGKPDSDSVVSSGYSPSRTTARPELVEAIKHIVDTMMYSESSQTTDADIIKKQAQKRIDSARKTLDYYAEQSRAYLVDGTYNKGKKTATKEQLAQFDAMVERLKNGDAGAEVYIENPSKLRGAMGFMSYEVIRDLSALVKSVTGRGFLKQDPQSTGRKMRWDVDAILDNNEKLNTKEAETKTVKGRTSYYIESKRIDQSHVGDYWSSPEEMGARAFESYIFDKITEQGNRSDYLVHGVENRYYAPMDMYPYPEGAERKAINKAFDSLFSTLKTEETDKGVALYSKGNNQKSAPLPQPEAESRIKSILGDKATKTLIDAGMIRMVDSEAQIPGGGKLMTAYHGSPHDHDGFNSANIGTGEGAQAYGWGHYFAGAREVAEWYRKGLSRKDLINKARDAYSEFDDPDSALELLLEDNSLSAAQKELLSALQADDWLGFDYPHQAIQAAFKEPENFDLSDRTKAAIAAQGRLYTVDLKPSEDEYLLWDKPLSEQSEKVKAALEGNETIAERRQKLESRKHIYTKSVDAMMDMSGQELYELIADNPTTTRAPGDKAASEYLKSIGIRGIKYLDGSSRSQGDGNYNYVIFDDADIEITRKESNSGQVLGATMPDGTIYLNLGALNESNISGVFKHEGFHASAREWLGEQSYSALMNRLERLRTIATSRMAEGKAMGQWYEKANAAIPNSTRESDRNEELAGYAIEQYANGEQQPSVIRKWVEDFLSALRTAIIKHLPNGRLKLWAIGNLKPQDLANLAIAGLKAKARGMQAQGREAMAYSKSLPDTINVDGIDRPTTNSNGKPIHPTEEGIRNFWKWFGDSKVVDAQGRPLVVYHGTAYDFASFKQGRNRSELNEKYQGDGFHFSADPRIASRYADANRNQLLRKADIYPLVDQRFPDRIAKLFKDVVEEGYDKAWDVSDDEVSAILQTGRDAGIDLNDLLDLAEVVEGSRYHAGRDGANDPGEVFSALFGGSGNRLLSEYHIDDMVKMGIDDAAPAQNVIPVYLKSDNPLVTDSRKKARSAQKNGHDGVSYSGPDLVGGVPEWVVFSQGQIKSAIGNTGAFDPSNPDIRYSRASNNATPPAGQPQPSGPWQSANAKFSSLTGPDAINTLIYNFQDKYVDLKNVIERIKKMNGALTDMNDARLGEEMYHSKVMKKTKDFAEHEIKPLLQQLFNNGIKKEDFEQYLHARHAPEANAVLAERNPNQKMIDAGKAQADADVKALEVKLQHAKAQGAATKALEASLEKARAEKSKWNGAQAFQGTEEERSSLSGMSDQAAAQVMAAIPAGKLAAMKGAAAKVDAIQAKTLAELEKSGLMDKASLDAWRAEYQHYVPLHRDEAHPDSTSHPVGQGFSVRGDAAKRRTGSNEKVTNILGHIAMQREAAITRGEKNSVSKRLYLLAAQNPLKDFWQVDRPPMLKTIDPRTGFVRSQIDPTYKNKPNVLIVRIAGKDAAIVFNEHNPEAVRLAGALKNLDGQDLDVVEKTIGAGTRWFASVNTQYNPIFGFINFARDVQGGMLNLTSTELKDRKVAVWRETMRLFKEMSKAGFRLDKMNATDRALWNDFQDNGGATGYRDLFANPEDRAKALEKELNALGRGSASKRFHAVADWLSSYNEAMENVVRMAAYKIGIQNGMSKERAASLAKNLTVNFNRKGAKAQKLGAFYAFFNASVQGTARMGQTLKGPVGKKIIIGGIALGVMQQMLGMLMMGGGDDDEWDKIPDFVKERSLIFPTGKDTYVAIPMPLGFNILPNIGRLFAEWSVGGKDKPTAQQMGKLFNIVLGSLNPIGGRDVVDMVSPTVADPVVSLLRNQDWTGKPIYREDRANLDPTPGFTRTKDTATPWAKGMSYVVNLATGGSDFQPGRISWTPDQIDYVIGQLTGGAGRELGKFAQTIAAPFSGDELPIHKVPLAGRIIGSTAGVSGQSERFYENVRALNGIEREIKGLATSGGNVGAYMDSEPRSSLVGMASAAESQVKKLREAQRNLKKQGDAAGAKEIDGMVAEVMKGLNTEVRAANR